MAKAKATYSPACAKNPTSYCYTHNFDLNGADFI
ncbi:hypothetical protein BCI9360_02920 [Bacillus sp. CECT 9360]|nr:hypothetical protein BCI9360_02920 [Bacillus sp. CECT 9360]